MLRNFGFTRFLMIPSSWKGVRLTLCANRGRRPVIPVLKRRRGDSGEHSERKDANNGSNCADRVRQRPARKGQSMSPSTTAGRLACDIHDGRRIHFNPLSTYRVEGLVSCNWSHARRPAGAAHDGRLGMMTRLHERRNARSLPSSTLTTDPK
jgi:hypothetical protein